MDYLPGAVRSKFGGYTASQIIEPMCFNNYVPDNEAEFCFAREPEKRVETDRFVSHAGEILISLLIVPAVLLSRFAPQALSLVPPALMLRKHFKKPSGPEYKY